MLVRPAFPDKQKSYILTEICVRMCIGTLLDQREENTAFFNGWIVEPTMEH